MATGPSLVFGQLVFPLNKVNNTVGRKDRITNVVPDVDLGTLDQERSVSRRHAELAYDRGTVTLRDLGSTNGTTVAGSRLAVQVDRVLGDGDAVAFGAVTLTYHAAADWPEGVEAEWPPEPGPEETMVAPGIPAGPEETMVAPAPEETMIAPPVSTAPEAAQAEPHPMPELPSVPEPPGIAELPPMPEMASESAAPVEVEPEAYVACSNHPHLPAIGVCPGCLEAYCVDCLPEREDGLMVCNRCAGISYRLAAATATPTAPAVPAPTAATTPPATSGPADFGSPPLAAPEKKRWPF